ncbi:MAG TPA: hypothetical protein VMW49_00660 [Candidatus Dormibacteraeota bacterium]|nr:hypothetical protein [Candidatus Dormibacteraeota bacterium]
MTARTGARIAVIGDHDARLPTHRALDDAVDRFAGEVAAAWIPTEALAAGASAPLAGINGLWLAPGTPYRSFGGALAAIRHARERAVPLLATCGGFQHVVVEYARHAAGIGTAAHAEVDPAAPDPVIAPMACALRGERRWVRARPGTRAAAICGLAPMAGYHFCGYGVAAGWVGRLEAAGLVVSGTAADAGVEIVELPGHPFYLATLFQPQVTGDGQPAGGPLHPLVAALVAAAVRHHAAAGGEGRLPG